MGEPWPARRRHQSGEPLQQLERIGKRRGGLVPPRTPWWYRSWPPGLSVSRSSASGGRRTERTNCSRRARRRAASGPSACRMKPGHPPVPSSPAARVRHVGRWVADWPLPATRLRDQHPPHGLRTAMVRESTVSSGGWRWRLEAAGHGGAMPAAESTRRATAGRAARTSCGQRPAALGGGQAARAGVDEAIRRDSDRLALSAGPRAGAAARAPRPRPRGVRARSAGRCEDCHGAPVAPRCVPAISGPRP
jgi:hypothetical protein